MRNLLKKITHPFLKLGLKLYYYKPRKYSYDGIEILVHPDVFPPHLTLSTKILLDFIKPLELENKTFIELGCGSGIISLLASKKGAKVFSSDINKTALEFLKNNAEKNKLKLDIIFSNLFESIPNQSFDYIIINPPYYPNQPKNIKEHAWFCGINFEYFEELFSQLPQFLSDKTNCLMILSEDCELEKIKAIALKNGMALNIVYETNRFSEKNFIFKVS